MYPTPTSIKVPGLKEAMQVNARSRAGSQSSSGARAPSIFSEAESFTTADTSPSQYSDEEEESDAVESDTKTVGEDDELEIISKETFEANVGKRGLDEIDVDDGSLKVINGSTLGGSDPLHAMVQVTGHEPRWWVDERQRNDRSSKKRKLTSTNPRRSIYTQAYFDSLPYSPQDYFTSGLDIECEPEQTSEEFWDKVSEAFKLSCRYETVEDRRDGFDYDCFDSAPGTPTPSRFNDELSVV